MTDPTSNPVAIITGASRGIGRELALYFAKSGYDCALIARREDLLKKVQQEIESRYDVNTGVFPLDVTNHEKVEHCVNHIIQHHNRIDVLVNSAGSLILGTSSIKPKDFDLLMQVNLKGMYNFIHQVVPKMKEQGGGYIFNMSSLSGKEAYPDLGAYALTKYGVLGYNEALFKELIKYKIKVTALCPGTVATEMTAGFSDFPESEKIPVIDIAKTIDFLLNLDGNTYIKDIDIFCRYRELEQKHIMKEE